MRRGKEIDFLLAIRARARRAVLASYPTDTVSGNPANFPDGADDVPVVDLKVSIEPVQDLHGYDNPWPAGGGKNLLYNPRNDSVTINNVTFTKNSNGSVTVNSDGPASANSAYIIWNRNETSSEYKRLPTGTYTVSGCPNGGGFNTYQMQFQATREGSLYNFGVDNGSGITGTSQSDDSLQISIVIYSDFTASNLVFWPQIEAGSSKTAFAPYSNICPISGWTGMTLNHSGADTSDPETVSVSWQSEAGTVYGGTLDVTTGVLTVTNGYIASYAGETLPGEWISDRDVYAAGTSPSTGAQVVYALAEPVAYQLTPTQVRTLYGENNLWADCGPVEAEYRADLEKYIEKKIGEEKAES